MKTPLLTFALMCLLGAGLLAQVPQGFNYQAIARDNSGNPITDKTIKVMLSILSDTLGFKASGAGTYIWEEEHLNVKTNSFGLFTVVLGTGTRTGGSAALFSEINWSLGQRFIGIKVANPTTYKIMGSAKLWTVPYSMVSSTAAKADAITAGSKLSVVSANDAAPGALFEVKRKDGQTVFAVYPDSVNVFIPDGAKAGRGGFAVGGFDRTKSYSQDFLRVTPDSVRIYIDNTPAKGSRGGFAVGGFDRTKSGNLKNMYMNITGSTAVDKVLGSPQVLWYPNKNAFLAGNVRIFSPDSVGDYSTALGYQSMAPGDYSQAFGYKAKAMGDYSTSIGKRSVAGVYNSKHNAYAFGNAAQALGEGSFAFGNSSRTLSTSSDSYAFGSGAEALGLRSFALGSVALDTTGIPTSTPTRAIGNYSTAIGMGAQASGLSAFALGVGTSASSNFSSVLGAYSSAAGQYSLALGYRATTTSSANYSAAIGYYSSATNYYAYAFGLRAKAEGLGSLSMGFYSNSLTDYSTAVGYRAKTEGTYSSAFGRDALASGTSSIAVGYGAKTTTAGIEASAFGKNAIASNTTAMALGVSATASGLTSTAIGNLAQATAQNALAIGNSNISSGNFSVTLGNSNTAGTNTNAIALGNSNVSSGVNSISLGNNNTSSNSYSTAIGTYTTSSNTYSTAIGYYAVASGSKSLSIGAKYTYTLVPKPIIIIPRLKGDASKGDLPFDDPDALPAGIDASGKGIIPIYNMNRNNIADGSYSIAVGNGNNSTNGGASFGVYNESSALYSTAIGFQNHATGPYSFAGGYLNEASGDFASAFGRSTVAQSENSFVIGRYNAPLGSLTEWIDTEPLFQIGNGSSTSETHDAFRVLKNGGTSIYASDASTGLYLYHTINERTSTTYGIYSYVRSYMPTTYYYSGYFNGYPDYNATTNPYYLGLYADYRTGDGIDVAEYIYDSEGNTEPADVVVADPGKKESVLKSSKPYQTSVLGAITTKPHMVMGNDLVLDPATGKQIPGVKATRLALSGRVPVKVSMENGPILPGDNLTSSSTPGTAMKWSLLDVNSAKDFDDLKRILAENEKRRNAIIGKAVEPFSGPGNGKIMVLISPQ